MAEEPHADTGPVSEAYFRFAREFRRYEGLDSVELENVLDRDYPGLRPHERSYLLASSQLEQTNGRLGWPELNRLALGDHGSISLYARNLLDAIEED